LELNISVLRTKSVVSSAYLKISFIAEIEHRSFFIIIYSVGPIPDPCTILRPLSITPESNPLILHC